MGSFSGLSNYYKQTLSGIIISRGDIKNKEFEECIFTKIHLTDCRIEKCKFINCRFENSILSAIKPTDSVFTDIQWTDCKVIGFDWTLAKSIRFLTFTNCQINYSNFRFLVLPKIRLVNCIAKEADFTETDLSEGDFTGTDFEGSRFFRTNLTKANFKKSKNYTIDIRSNTVKKAQFSFPQAMALLDSLDISVEY